MFATSASVIPYIKAGPARAAGSSTTAKRSPGMPELPTVSEAGAESGLSGHSRPSPGTASSCRTRRRSRWSSASTPISSEPWRSATCANASEGLGAELAPGSPREFADYIAREIPKWAKVVRIPAPAPNEVVVTCCDLRETRMKNVCGRTLVHVRERNHGG